MLQRILHLTKALRRPTDGRRRNESPVQDSLHISKLQSKRSRANVVQPLVRRPPLFLYYPPLSYCLVLAISLIGFDPVATYKVVDAFFYFIAPNRLLPREETSTQRKGEPDRNPILHHITKRHRKLLFLRPLPDHDLHPLNRRLHLLSRTRLRGRKTQRHLNLNLNLGGDNLNPSPVCLPSSSCRAKFCVILFDAQESSSRIFSTHPYRYRIIPSFRFLADSIHRRYKVSAGKPLHKPQPIHQLHRHTPPWSRLLHPRCHPISFCTSYDRTPGF